MSATMSSMLIRQVTSELSQLPEEDLPLVVEFVEYLKQHREASRPGLSPSEIRAEARHRAALLQDMPRKDIVIRFRELADEIRQEAITKGTAVEGDWQGD